MATISNNHQMKTASNQIESIFQLCIRRTSDINFNFAFIYQMSGGTLSFQEFELNLEKARQYFDKHEWPLALPDETGKTIMVVRSGRYVGNYPLKNTDMPPK